MWYSIIRKSSTSLRYSILLKSSTLFFFFFFILFYFIFPFSTFHFIVEDQFPPTLLKLPSKWWNVNVNVNKQQTLPLRLFVHPSHSHTTIDFSKSLLELLKTLFSFLFLYIVVCGFIFKSPFSLKMAIAPFFFNIYFMSQCLHFHNQNPILLCLWES